LRFEIFDFRFEIAAIEQAPGGLVPPEPKFIGYNTASIRDRAHRERVGKRFSQFAHSGLTLFYQYGY
jgi:hypothetical protein